MGLECQASVLDRGMPSPRTQPGPFPPLTDPKMACAAPLPLPQLPRSQGEASQLSDPLSHHAMHSAISCQTPALCPALIISAGSANHSDVCPVPREGEVQEPAGAQDGDPIQAGQSRKTSRGKWQLRRRGELAAKARRTRKMRSVTREFQVAQDD